MQTPIIFIVNLKKLPEKAPFLLGGMKEKIHF
jgi:hypothetical protein